MNRLTGSAMLMRSTTRVLSMLSILALVLNAPAGAAEVNGTLFIDSSRLAGGDDLGRVLLYTPDPLQRGSSVSHWDTSVSPDLLMEPAISSSLTVGDVDLTLPQMLDIGWPPGTSTFAIRVQDGPDSGFNDPTEVAAAPSNPGGTTLGGQRLAAMEWVAGVWAELLGSSIEINIDARFVESYECDAGGGVLAAAGSAFLFFDFSNTPRAATWYHGALAESLAGENLSSTEDGFPPNAGDLSIFFNSKIDEECLGPGTGYYYGLDGNTLPGKVSFVQVALHEISHGLGFANFSNDQTGELFGVPEQGIPRMPDIYNVFSFDNDQMLHWDVMTNEGRATSAINPGGVVWDGPQTTAAAGDFLDSSQNPSLVINLPETIAGSYAAMPAAFGPPFDDVGITGDLAVVSDGSADATLGCDTLVNADDIAGKIAVIDRGACNFTEKVKNAQDAGAVAAIVVNNVPGDMPPMGGIDDSVTIPSAGISQEDGDRIKEILALELPPPRRGGRRVIPGG